jgi:hypothetical protein
MVSIDRSSLKGKQARLLYVSEFRCESPLKNLRHPECLAITIVVANSGHQTQYTVGIDPGVLLLRYKCLRALGDDGELSGAIPVPKALSVHCAYS